MKDLEKQKDALRRSFKVPEGYFERNEVLLKAVAHENKKTIVVSLFKTPYFWLSGAAASLLIGLFFFTENGMFTGNDIPDYTYTYITDQEIEDYLIHEYQLDVLQPSLSEMISYENESPYTFEQISAEEINAELDQNADELLLYQF